MSVEIDGFKDLFMRIGRAGAEAIIKKVGAVLADTIRREDSVARTSVAGFAISMPLAKGENALELANRICQTVESFRAKLDGKKITITVSIGVCAVEPSSTGDVDIVLDVADMALSRAARLGRSQLYQMTLQDYHREQAVLQSKTLSIDGLLTNISNGEQSNVVPYLNAALERLSPLFVLLSNEQKQRVITYR
jgi:diguanylate cyclase (GGDEF)-like protein